MPGSLLDSARDPDRLAHPATPRLRAEPWPIPPVRSSIRVSPKATPLYRPVQSHVVDVRPPPREAPGTFRHRAPLPVAPTGLPRAFPKP